jgi:2,4-dichlorophenol 6-monooxygenase
MLGDPARRAGVAAAIANQAEHFDMLGLQLGYRYASSAIVEDNGDIQQDGGRAALAAAAVVSNPVRDFVPNGVPGSRLPHCWTDTTSPRTSTLDLVATEGLTMIVDNEELWRDAVRSLAVPLSLIEWDRSDPERDRWWREIAGLGDGGALLVRPDQHIVTRFVTVPHDCREALSRVVSPLLAPSHATACA